MRMDLWRNLSGYITSFQSFLIWVNSIHSFGSTVFPSHLGQQYSLLISFGSTVFTPHLIWVNSIHSSSHLGQQYSLLISFRSTVFIRPLGQYKLFIRQYRLYISLFTRQLGQYLLLDWVSSIHSSAQIVRVCSLINWVSGIHSSVQIVRVFIYQLGQ